MLKTLPTIARKAPEPHRARPRWETVAVSMRATSARWLVVALLAVALLTAVMLPFRAQLGVLNVLLLYLLLTFVLALSGGLWPAVLGAVLGFLTLNLLFIPPYLTLTVAAADHLLALVVYLALAIVTAHLVSRVRERTAEARRESRRIALLAELNAALIGDATLDAILARIAERVVTVYGAQGCRVLVRDEAGNLDVGAYYPERIGKAVSRAGLALAEWAVANRQPIGQSRRGGRIIGRVPGATTQSQSGDVLFLPIMTAERVVGVLEVTGRPGAAPFRAEDEAPLTTFVDQAALALERTRLSAEAAQAAALAQTDELKSALLAAVSHDLRTPLASIKAAATSLLDESVDWSAADRRELLGAIDEETDRLTLMVSNLLDLSRIEGGALRPRRDWYDLDELIADVRRRLASRAAGHPMTVAIEPDLPPVRFDYTQIANVLVNLLDNAVAYTPPGTAIAITARRLPGAVEIAVHDEGPGIPLESQLHLFDKFYRTSPATSPSGTGIGLTIAKGLVEAHGGRIWVESAPDTGTTFRFTLPLETGAKSDPSPLPIDPRRSIAA